MIKRYGFILIAALSLAACRGAAATTEAAQGAHPSQAPPVVLTSGTLTVTITSPAAEAVVSAPQVQVEGQAPPETVISIGDSIMAVDATGQFSLGVPLEEGPNELAIVVSDPAGNQASARLVVTYDPAS